MEAPLRQPVNHIGGRLQRYGVLPIAIVLQSGQFTQGLTQPTAVPDCPRPDMECGEFKNPEVPVPSTMGRDKRDGNGVQVPDPVHVTNRCAVL